MFIQVIQGRCTRPDELRAALEKWQATIGTRAPGWLGATHGVTDDDEFVSVVRFESRESAMALSGSEEQSAWWAETEQLFDGPVEFLDCDKVLVMLDGGSDHAGFVQVIRGKVDDPSRLEADLDRMTDALREIRPDIIGSTIAIAEDGTFTETVAFTDEAAAREGESRQMPVAGEVREMWEEWERITRDLTYLDLHRPWFQSPA